MHYRIPGYQGAEWLSAKLPDQPQHWLDGNKHGLRQRKTGHKKSKAAVKELLQQHPWQWPKRPVIFISDLHADADALLESLVASGGIKRTGAKDHQFRLTSDGKNSTFVLGGDFFDKGPSNLRLLRCLNILRKKGARLRILAGNHDIRTLIGMRSLGNTEDPRDGHFFVRMGAKAIPFLREIRDEFLTDKGAMKHIPDAEECRKRIFPGKKWQHRFPDLAAGIMHKERLEREIAKLEKKCSRFEHFCEREGINLREAYAACLKWQELFLHPKGEFSWFLQKMQLAHRKGSFLFIHAGLDDDASDLLHAKGVKGLNKQFQKQLQGSPFDFYYGPVANTIRTKYRDVDLPLTQKGGRVAHKAGVHAIVHGHRNLRRGQRIAIRKTLLHFECDVTLDSGSRRAEGLKGAGAGATIFHPRGYVLGICSDHNKIKVFDPEAILKQDEQ